MLTLFQRLFEFKILLLFADAEFVSETCGLFGEKLEYKLVIIVMVVVVEVKYCNLVIMGF